MRLCWDLCTTLCDQLNQASWSQPFEAVPGVRIRLNAASADQRLRVELLPEQQIDTTTRFRDGSASATLVCSLLVVQQLPSPPEAVVIGLLALVDELTGWLRRQPPLTVQGKAYSLMRVEALYLRKHLEEHLFAGGAVLTWQGVHK